MKAELERLIPDDEPNDMVWKVALLTRPDLNIVDEDPAPESVELPASAARRCLLAHVGAIAEAHLR